MNELWKEISLIIGGLITAISAGWQLARKGRQTEAQTYYSDLRDDLDQMRDRDKRRDAELSKLRLELTETRAVTEGLCHYLRDVIASVPDKSTLPVVPSIIQHLMQQEVIDAD